MGRSLASNALTIFIVLMLAVASLLAWGKGQYSNESDLAEAICVQVAPGSSMTAVSNDLAERGAISNATVFRLGADYSGQTDRLKAGSFLVPEKASMADIVNTITGDGRSTCGTEVNYRVGILSSRIQVRELDPATQKFVEVAAFDPSEGATPAAYKAVKDEVGTRYRVVLAEGVTSWQVTEALKQAEFLSGEIAEVPREGHLAPDSYDVQPGSDRTALLARMETAQDKILADLWATRAPGLPLKTPDEALILASIVEKETGLPDERNQVASVFINRMERGMRLQTDPTVIYGITLGKGSLGRGLRQSELRKGTPYNTYVIEGLPPTPIANPGRNAIAAALNPDTTDYLFFVADGTGGHAFAQTLEEHNRNVAEWRKIEAQN